jgi:hypothetical protein
MHDDTQQLSPTPSDNDRPRPTESDTVRPSPTMSATRTEAHTLTTREVMKMFEAAGIPRAQRSIERYCQQGLGVAKAEILAKWSYVSNCQGLGVSHT